MYVMHDLGALGEVLGVPGVSHFSVKGARNARLAIVVGMVIAVVVVAVLVMVFLAMVMLFTDILDMWQLGAAGNIIGHILQTFWIPPFSILQAFWIPPVSRR
mmetsp:Transcript_12339/g.29398  ORF Transcript_12339/g.29398 Transcript_12339/m.29398 type:complete len:102 (+) Transcript_12339:288-593(+)